MTFIFLYVVLSLCAFNEGICDNDSIIASCGNFMKDWFSNIAPQTSVAPYVLNVSSDDNDKFNTQSWKDPRYFVGVQTGLLPVTLFVVY